MIDTETRPFLVFGLNKDKFALDVSCVTEIIRTRELNVMPEMPPELLGLFRFRDRVVPLIDLKARLGLPRMKAADPDEERIVIVLDGDRWLGLKVDAIHEMIPIQEPQIPALKNEAESWHEIIEGVWPSDGDRILLLKFTAVVDPARTIDLAGWKEQLQL